MCASNIERKSDNVNRIEKVRNIAEIYHKILRILRDINSVFVIYNQYILIYAKTQSDVRHKCSVVNSNFMSGK